jgi:hypothetical protein
MSAEGSRLTPDTRGKSVYELMPRVEDKPESLGESGIVESTEPTITLSQESIDKSTEEEIQKYKEAYGEISEEDQKELEKFDKNKELNFWRDFSKLEQGNVSLANFMVFAYNESEKSKTSGELYDKFEKEYKATLEYYGEKIDKLRENLSTKIPESCNIEIKPGVSKEASLNDIVCILDQTEKKFGNYKKELDNGRYMKDSSTGGPPNEHQVDVGRLNEVIGLIGRSWSENLKGIENLLKNAGLNKRLLKEDASSGPSTKRLFLIIGIVVAIVVIIAIVLFFVLKPGSEGFSAQITSAGVYGNRGVPLLKRGTEHMLQGGGVPANYDIMDMGLGVGMDMPPMMIQQKRSNDEEISRTLMNSRARMENTSAREHFQDCPCGCNDINA